MGCVAPGGKKLDGMGGQTHAPAALAPGKTRYPLYRSGWVPGPVWTGAENLAPPENDRRTVQAVASRYTN